MELSSDEKIEESSICDILDDDEGFLSTGDKGISSFKVELDGKLRNESKTIIFTEGAQASTFGKKYILPANQESVGKVFKEIKLDGLDIELWGLRNPKPEPSLLYQISEGIILCVCSASLSSEDFYPFASSVVNSFTNKLTILALTVASVSHFRSDFQPESDHPIIRILATSYFPNSLKIQKLEQPNILTGTVAGILTVCEMKAIPAISCIIYSSSLILDDGMVKNFSSFLRSIDSSRLLTLNVPGRLQSIEKSAKTGNLYI